MTAFGKKADIQGLIRADFASFWVIWWPELGRIGLEETLGEIDGRIHFQAHARVW